MNLQICLGGCKTNAGSKIRYAWIKSRTIIIIYFFLLLLSIQYGTLLIRWWNKVGIPVFHSFFGFLISNWIMNVYLHGCIIVCSDTSLLWYIWWRVIQSGHFITSEYVMSSFASFASIKYRSALRTKKGTNHTILFSNAFNDH